MIKNIIIKILILLSLIISSCFSKNNSQEPIWYLNPSANNANFIFGVGQAKSQSEATKAALVDMASRLIVTISAQSSTLINENNFGIYDEIRQKISQNIEDITFINYQMSNSLKIKDNYFIEVTANKDEFFNDQLQRFRILNKKITNIDQSSSKTNIVSRKTKLLQINQLIKEANLKLTLLRANNKLSNPNKYQDRYLKYQNELENITNKIEFFLDDKMNPTLKNIITKSLNDKNIKISQQKNPKNKQQIFLKISQQISSKKIYNNFITQNNLTFKNIVNNKIIASNKITINGSSVISAKQSQINAFKEFDQRLKQENILAIIGIL